MRNKTTITLTAGGCLLILALVLGLCALQVAVVYWLWNWLVPALFAGPTITFWQTLGLIILVNFIGTLLFKRGK